MEGQKTVKLLNALPLAALTSKSAVLEVREIAPEEIPKDVKYESYIGHPATARALSQLIGQEIPVNRSEAKLMPGDTAIIAVLTKRVQGDVEVSLSDLRFFLVKIK